MKFLFVLPCVMLAQLALCQETETIDNELSSKAIGTWVHVRSEDPLGNVVSYERQFELYSDGTGLCTKYIQGDSLSMTFTWEVKDSTIYLFVTNKRGKSIQADSQHISRLDEKGLYMDEICEAGYEGISCMYRRKTNQVAKY